METEAGTWKRKRKEAQKRDFLKNVLEARFRKLPQGSDSDSGSEAGSGRPMKLPCNVALNSTDLVFMFFSFILISPIPLQSYCFSHLSYLSPRLSHLSHLSPTASPPRLTTTTVALPPPPPRSPSHHHHGRTPTTTTVALPPPPRDKKKIAWKLRDGNYQNIEIAGIHLWKSKKPRTEKEIVGSSNISFQHLTSSYDSVEPDAEAIGRMKEIK
ncbi:hypothetical protein YC2023_121864 [Brassica napus]